MNRWGVKLSARRGGGMRADVDVLVIGGGIQGAAIAWAAARRGLRTTLVEQEDWGHGASANSQKVIHGGLRYLQQLDFRRMRRSIRARSEWLRLAPHLVAPHAFMMPTRGWGCRGRAALGAALALNAAISADRNRNLPPDRQLPAGHLLSRAQGLERLPGLDGADLDGAAVWYDGLAADTERLTWNTVRAALRAGAEARNYMRATALSVVGGRVCGAAIEDRENGWRGEVRAAVTVLAGGPWLSRLIAAPGAPAIPSEPPGWVRGWNLVVRRPWVGPWGAALQRNGRNLFFVPWRGGTLVGTWYAPAAGDPEACGLTREDLAHAVAETRAVFPAWGLCEEDVVMAHVGLLPARRAGSADPSKQVRVTAPWNGGSPGVVVLQAVKYTTALVEGEHLVAALQRRGLAPAALPPAPPTPWVEPATGDAVVAWGRARGLDLPPAVAAGLAQRHGSDFTAVLSADGLDAAADVQPLAADTDVCRAEVRHAVRREQAQRLADVVLRRTGMGSFAAPSSAAIAAVTAVMAAEAGWDSARQAAERAALQAFYARRALAG